MKLSTLALLAGAVLAPGLYPAGAAAQDTEETVRPRVAELVRSALSEPEEAETWEGLAELLPELALTDQADVVSVFEASRLADSIASVPLLPAQLLAESRDRALRDGIGETTPAQAPRQPLAAATPTLSGLWPQVMEALRSLSTRDLLTAAPWAAVVVLLGVRALLQKRTRAKRRTSSRTAAGESPAVQDSKAQRRWTVTTLAESGLPPAEIARRTGMAQDAVHVLLGLRSSPSAPVSRGGTGDLSGIPGFGPTRPASRPPSLAEQAAGIATAREQFTREARRLKGGRVTYGPGRLA